MEVKVEIVSKEIIKPSSATPHHLKTVNLSIVDHLSPSIYTSFVFFYTSFNDDGSNLIEKKLTKLKQSLSDNLVRFYPFAGRLRHVSIDCNDEGVVFIDAKVNCFLSEFLRNPDLALLQSFLPADILSKEAATWPLLLVQVNVFRCGGVAIGICVSHKFSDATSMATFMKSWSATALGVDHSIFPLFDAAMIFPVTEPSLSLNEVHLTRHNCVTKRFVFDFYNITALQAMARRSSSSAHVREPTRVEVVTAVLWKCASKAARSNSGFVRRRSVLLQAVDVRRRNTKLQLSENNIGNLLNHFIVRNENPEASLGELVKELRQKKEEMEEMCREKLEAGDQASYFSIQLAKETTEMLSNGDEQDCYMCSSWCRMSLYETDLGWGKPKWVTSNATAAFKNIILLMDARDNKGIEAWVTLTDEDMSLFEHDTELLSFASQNPTVVS